VPSLLILVLAISCSSSVWCSPDMSMTSRDNTAVGQLMQWQRAPPSTIGVSWLSTGRTTHGSKAPEGT
jgi:hypothetical protein